VRGATTRIELARYGRLWWDVAAGIHPAFAANRRGGQPVAVFCPEGFYSLRWMRKAPVRGRAPGWLTVSRSLPISSTQQRTGPWPSAKRQARRRAANDDALDRPG
jgi:hypothetical protein